MTAREPTIKIERGDYRTVLDGAAEIALIFTSPPYNIGSKALRQDGQRKLGKFDPKSFGGIRGYPDASPEDAYQDSQVAFLLWCADRLAPDGVLVYNHKPRRRRKALILPEDWLRRPEVRARLTLADVVVWDRGSTHNHDKTMMWPQTERLYVLYRADGSYGFRNGADLPFRSDVWRIPPPRPNGHACPFPSALAEAVVETWSSPGDLVCDPYAGSGTTAMAALKLGRRFVGAEIEERYWRQAEAAATAAAAGWGMVA